MPRNSPRWTEAFADLERRYPAHRFVLGDAEVAESLATLDALVASRLPEGLLAGATSLKALFVPLAGLNHLPVAELAAAKIRVFNVHANAEAVAQNALALILAHFGRLIEYHLDLREKKWHGFWVGKGSEDEWDTIYDRRCAILGTGAIGRALARLLKPFRCEIVGWRRHPEAPLPAGFDRVEADLEKAVAGVDIVIAALPLTADTRGLITGKTLASMQGAFLVNVGRAAVIDEEALYAALRDGVLRGAGLDVWYEYPRPGSTSAAPSRFPIHELPNVVLSPHVAGSARQSSAGAIEGTVANLRSWLETGSAPNETDLAEEY
jgi:phosphoglycerate dehydrogenase-like enzyme